MNDLLNGRSYATKTVKASKVKASKARTHKPKLTRGDKVRASAFFALAVCGLGVSLPHLASELGQLTGTTDVASWLVAIIIDLGMCATKAYLSIDGRKYQVAWTVVSACTVVSIMLNSHAFLAHSVGTFGQVAAIGFGIFLPLFILALSYLGSEILSRKV
jgi:hypothetical protein